MEEKDNTGKDTEGRIDGEGAKRERRARCSATLLLKRFQTTRGCSKAQEVTAVSGTLQSEHPAGSTENTRRKSSHDQSKDYGRRPSPNQSEINAFRTRASSSAKPVSHHSTRHSLQLSFFSGGFRKLCLIKYSAGIPRAFNGSRTGAT